MKRLLIYSKSRLEAAYYLGRELLSGEVVAKDEKQAFKAFEFAKIHGSNLGFLWVGICYLKGHGCEKDYSKALEIFESPLLADNSLSYYYLGVMHASGLGVPVDKKKALEFYQKSADTVSQNIIAIGNGLFLNLFYFVF